MTPFIGFQPDVDPTTAGIFKDCENIVPTTKGFRAFYSQVNAGLTAVSDDVNSLAVVENLAGTRYTYAGTDNTLEEAGAAAWTDRTRAVGGAYSCGADDRWSFAAFGNTILAANIADTMQAATMGAAFADISGSPQAKYIAVSQGFVMAANLSTNADGWHCSAYLDHTDWTEAVSTQCTSGRLVGGGQITGLKALGTGFVIFKRNSMYVGSYVGAPVVFQWDEVPGDVGTATSNAAVSVKDTIFFLGNDDFYAFDGARPVPIGHGVREWFFEHFDQAYDYKTIASYNEATGNIIWYYVSEGGNGSIDSAIVYNVWSNKWGKFSASIVAAATYYSGGIIIDGATTDLSDLYATIDDMTDISFDSPYWASAVATAGVIKSDNILYTLTGTPGASSITMNTFGDDETYSTITRVRPRFLTEPTTTTIDYSYDNYFGDGFTYKGTYSLNNGKYDLLYSARWHQVKLNFTGEMEINGARISIVEDGVQ